MENQLTFQNESIMNSLNELISERNSRPLETEKLSIARTIEPANVENQKTDEEMSIIRIELFKILNRIEKVSMNLNKLNEKFELFDVKKQI